MKKVLVLNGDSFVGRQVVKAFYQSQEYDVEITRTKADAQKAAASRATAMADTNGWMWTDAMTRDDASAGLTPPNNVTSAMQGGTKKRGSNNNNNVNTPGSPTTSQQRQQQRRLQEELSSLPADIAPCVCAIVPKHNDDTDGFRARLLANDIVVAVLEDDAYEATCAIRILESTHYEVEKTFVLVSSAVTWAYTLESERARARQTRQRERQEARASFLDDLLDEEEEGQEESTNGGGGPGAAAVREARRAARRQQLEQRLPHSLRDPLPGEDEEETRELVPDRTFTEDGYAQRVPHPRYQHWHALEHLVKRANTQTLHTYVVFAGLPYGAGEGETMLYGLLRAAWYHQPLLQYGPGTNALPMIHVQDLAAIVFKLGNSFDTLEERYVFAVDQGRVTQRQLLQAVQAKLGGSVQPATSSRYRPLDLAAQAAAATLAAMNGANASVSASTSAAAATAMMSSGSGTNHNGSATALASSLSAQPQQQQQQQQAALASASVPATSANVVKLDRLELPPPTSVQELFRVFGNEPCWGDGTALLSALVLSDIQAEPTAVLNLHPAEEWVALEGFTASLDLVVAQFREARGQLFRPVRTLITGPPLSGAETMGVLLARQCHAPFVALPTIVRDFTSHVAEVREALRVLLVRRLQRRRDRVQARLVSRATEEKHRRRAARAARREEKEAARRLKRQRGGGGDDDDDDNVSEADHADEDNAEGGVVDKDDVSSTASLNSSFSIFIPVERNGPMDGTGDGVEGGDNDELDAEDDDGGRRDGRSGEASATSPGRHRQAPTRPTSDVVDEAYIRGADAVGGDAAMEGDEDGEDGGAAGMIDEEQEEVEGGDGDGEGGATWLDQLEEQDTEQQAALMDNQELLPEAATAAGEGEVGTHLPRFAARRRGRAFARDVDRQELRCIAALRREYLLGLKVLALKVSAKDGRLPRPPQPPVSGGDDDDDGAAEGAATSARVGSGARKKAQRGRAGDDEDEEEGEEDGASDNDSHAESEAADRRGDGSATDAESNDDDDEEEEEEDEEDGDGHSSAAASNAEADASPSDYLDAALAFMFRWRLRQSDCRCQGYVLGDFPQTLAQAVLCFRANEAELGDGELRRQRALGPLLARLDYHEGGGAGDDEDGGAPVPPPMDEDFPLPDITTMEETQLRALESAHWHARGGRTPAAAAAGLQNGEADVDEASGMEPEEVMAPVDEALFVEQVVSLEGNTTLLRATAEALETSLRTAATSGQQAAGSEETEKQALDALRTFLSATPYATTLLNYQRHHASAAPPTQSLLAWLSAVTTTTALGVRPAPVVVRLSGDAAAEAERFGGTEAAGDGAADGAAATTLEAPPTTRTAAVVVVPAPVLSVAQVKASWCTAYDAVVHRSASTGDIGEGAALVQSTLPIALLRLAPLFWTGETSMATTTTMSKPSAPHASSRPPGRLTKRAAAHASAVDTSSLPASLTELHRTLCARLVPRPRLAACAGPLAEAGASGAAFTASATTTATTTTTTTATAATGGHGRAADVLSNGDGAPDELHSVSSITRERLDLSELEWREARLAHTTTKEAQAQVLLERSALRRLQLAEDSRDAAAVLQMPAEAYLMRFVLPSLTPAMTEVVRTRSDDPVTALADMLFDYHRRTTIK